MTEPPSLLRMLLSRHTKRREFIALLGGATATWPLAARAQQPDRARDRGVCVWRRKRSRRSGLRRALRQGLEQLGWFEGRNIHVDYRWASGDHLKADGAGGGASSRRRLDVAATEIDWRIPGGRPEQYPSYSCMSPTRSPAVWLRASRGRAETSQASRLRILAAKWLEVLKEIAPRRRGRSVGRSAKSNLDDARADHGEGGAVICGAADRGSCAQRRRDRALINAFAARPTPA